MQRPPSNEKEAVTSSSKIGSNALCHLSCKRTICKSTMSSQRSLDPSRSDADENLTDLDELVLSRRSDDTAKTICLSSIRREIEFSRPGSNYSAKLNSFDDFVRLAARLRATTGLKPGEINCLFTRVNKRSFGRLFIGHVNAPGHLFLTTCA